MTMESEKEKERSHSAIYLLRTVQQHHVQLSLMADNKAGVLLGASFVSLTILGAWASSGEAKCAAIVMGVSVLLTAFFSALSLIPRSQSFQSHRGEGNILFFGVFSQMEYGAFEDEVMEILERDEDIFRSMLRDIYSMGMLQQNRKYKFLRYSYLSFIFGLIAAPTAALAEWLIPLIQK